MILVGLLKGLCPCQVGRITGESYYNSGGVKMATKMQVSARYGTHLGAIIAIMGKTTGDVLELGMVIFSTPYLHYQCLLSKRKLVSYENYKAWLDFFTRYGYANEYHEINFVESYADAQIEGRH